MKNNEFILKSFFYRLRIPAEFINKQKTTDSFDDSKMSTQSRLDIDTDLDDSLFSTALLNDLSSPASVTSSVRTPLTGKSGFHSRRRGTFDDTDYLMGPVKSVHRRRADPRVSMATVLHEIFTELKSLPDSNELLQPVNAKLVKDYYNIVKNPMDLQQIRSRITENKYELRSQFVSDLGLIFKNSELYNGPLHPITMAAKKVIF